jgi:hypothetical protein
MNSDVKCIKITAEKDIIHERKFFDRHSKNLENLGDLENNMESHGAPEKKSGLGVGIAPLNFFGRTSLLETVLQCTSYCLSLIIRLK